MNTIPMTQNTTPTSSNETETETETETTLPYLEDQISPDMPAISVASKEELPDSVVRRYSQHVILVLDISESMRDQKKIGELNVANSALVRATAVPENRKGFKISEIYFNNKAERRHFGECATEIQIKPARAGGGTDFEKALKEVIKTIDEYRDRPNPDGFADKRPVVIFMSDGWSTANQDTIDHLHEIANVISVAFGDDADRSMLEKISSDGQVHRIGTRGGELTKFLAEVGETLSQEYQKNA